LYLSTVDGSIDHLEEFVKPAEGLRMEGGTIIVVVSIIRLDISSSIVYSSSVSCLPPSSLISL
jgi:hypothetical protein